jgi:Sec7-like guanine-nucleotide exchange factor
VYCPFRHPDTVHLLSYAAILLNTDLHRANTDNKKQSKKMTKEQFLNNLKGTDQGHNIDMEYISRIYENIKALPIELAVESNEAGGKTDKDDTSPSGGVAQDLSLTEEKLFAKDIARRLRDSEDLLRSLSPFTYRFQITGVDTNISLHLVFIYIYMYIYIDIYIFIYLYKNVYAYICI